MMVNGDCKYDGILVVTVFGVVQFVLRMHALLKIIIEEGEEELPDLKEQWRTVKFSRD